MSTAPAWLRETALATTRPAKSVGDPRTAFALHMAEFVNHYRPIWRALDPASFLILAASERSLDNELIFAFAAANGYQAAFIGDVLTEGRRFETTVSNHPWAAGTLADGSPALWEIGARHVRMMYALGKDGWNYAPWNERYDLILAWGPYQAERLAGFEHPRILQVGYPRFDAFFTATESRDTLVARLGGDPARPTLAWLPTWSRHSSIDAFAETIAALGETMNILLKVHPLTATTEPERMARLAGLGLKPVALTFDNVELFRAADIVAADYGSSAFGAIYADRDLVLLDVPGAASADDEFAGPESIDHRLREWILNIDPDEGHRIGEFLDDTSGRQQQAQVRDRLRRWLFAPFDGFAGEIAAAAIRHVAAVAR